MRFLNCLAPRGGLRELMLISALTASLVSQPVLAFAPNRSAGPTPVAVEQPEPQPAAAQPGNPDDLGALITPAEVLADPLVKGLKTELEATGFTILERIVERHTTDQDCVVMLPIAETGGAKATNPADELWTDSVRLAVQVLWTNHAARAVIESRVTWTDRDHITYMHQISLAGHPDARLRIVDRIVDRVLTRTVDTYVLNEQGQYVLSNEGPTDWSWRCIKSCLRDAGQRIGTWAAICLAACLIIGGVAGVVSGGAAFVPVFIACLRTCSGIALSSISSSLRSCLSGC